jgi:transposase
MPFMAQQPRVVVGMEACGRAHYWARRLREQGHEVKLMTLQYVKPYVKTNKNGLRDAEAITEAVTRPSMRFVPIKSVELRQFLYQLLHTFGQSPPVVLVVDRSGIHRAKAL